MQVQPRFGAILVKELSFKQGHSQSPVTKADFQLTGMDKETYQDLLGGASTPGNDVVSVSICDIRSGGLDREFRVNHHNLQFDEYTEDPQKRRVAVSVYQLVRSFLQNTPLADTVKQSLIAQLEKHAKRQGDSGANIPVKEYVTSTRVVEI